jgi:hypothetical protein
MQAVVGWFASITRRQFVIGLTVLFAVVSLQYTFKVLELRDGKQNRSAILRWREQLQQLDSGENIYERFTYPNPPIMALMLRPLAELPPLAGALIWFYMKVALAALSLAGIVRMIATDDEPFPPWAIGLGVVLSLRPVLGDLSHGNVNLLILFLVVATLFAYSSEWDFTAGVILALAIACKVTPALFVGYFLWKRSWRCLIGCGVGLALFFVIIPGALLGWLENLEFLSSWIKNMITPFVVGGVVTSDHPNQSLPGLISRLLTESPSFSTYVNDVYTPAAYHNWLSLSSAAARWIVKGCMAVFVGLVMWRCRTPSDVRRGWRPAAEWAIIVLGMLLFSERTWKHHCVTLALPYFVLCHRLVHDVAMRRRIVAVLIVAQAFIASTSTGLLPDDWAELAQVYGAYVGAFATLLFGLVCALGSRKDCDHVSPAVLDSAQAA